MTDDCIYLAGLYRALLTATPEDADTLFDGFLPAISRLTRTVMSVPLLAMQVEPCVEHCLGQARMVEALTEAYAGRMGIEKPEHTYGRFFQEVARGLEAAILMDGGNKEAS